MRNYKNKKEGSGFGNPDPVGQIIYISRRIRNTIFKTEKLQRSWNSNVLSLSPK
jgi:hypothetical protein